MKCIQQAHGDNWSAYQGDCVELTKQLPDNSIPFSIFSPPFQSLYVFSDSARDMSNCKTKHEFAEHFRYLIKELLRVMMPGRNVAVHCCNLPLSKSRDGFIGIQDFRGDLIRMFLNDEEQEFLAAIYRLENRLAYAASENDGSRVDKLISLIQGMREELNEYPLENGFIYHSEATIRKDPVVSMQRSKAMGLLHKYIKLDSAISRMGIPDYVETFRKPGKNEVPIKGILDHYVGTNPPQERRGHMYQDNYENSAVDSADFSVANGLSINTWQRYAEPVYSDVETNFECLAELTPHQLEAMNQLIAHEVGEINQMTWMDINQSDTLNLKKETKGNYKGAKHEDDVKHMTPLQLQVIHRCCQLWSNPGEVVFTPFGGIGSEGWEAVNMDRKAILFELKQSYFGCLIKNMKQLEASSQLSLLEVA